MKPTFQNTLNHSLEEYIVSGLIPKPEFTTIHHIESNETTTLHQKFSILGSISNYHWWNYICCSGQVSASSSHVNLHEHLMFHPSCDTNENNLREKYLPKSPRNRLMYYIINEHIYSKTAITATLKQLIEIDEGSKQISSLCETTTGEEDGPPHKKRRKVAHRIVKLTPDILCDALKMTLSSHTSSRHRSLYSIFTQQLITDGLISWRHHSSMKETVVLSDYDTTTGVLLPLSYVHVNCITTNEAPGYILTCSCNMYELMKSAAISKSSFVDDDTTVLDHETLTCMHCRFYKEHLHQFKDSLHIIDSSTSLRDKIKQSLEFMNNPVVLLGPASDKGSTKFSVKSNDHLAVVHMNFLKSGICYITCTNGECAAKMVNKKKMPKQFNISNTQNVCDHLHTVYANIEVIRDIFPLHFITNTDSTTEIQYEEHVDIPVQAEQNMDDIHIVETEVTYRYVMKCFPCYMRLMYL